MAKEELETVTGGVVDSGDSQKTAAVVVAKKSLFRFKEHYPAKESRNLFKLFQEMDLDDVMTIVPLAVKMVAGWEIDDDPTDPAAYDNLSIWMMLQLHKEIVAFWNDHLKN